MAMSIHTMIDESEVADAIRRGDLRLEHILQDALSDDATLATLIGDIEHLGGTHEAGRRTARFADAMQES